MGFVEMDKSLDDCLAEVAECSMPCAIRRLYATILAFCECANARALYDKYFDPMVEDYCRDTESRIMVEQRLLRDLFYHLTFMGKEIRDYGLPQLEESGNAKHNACTKIIKLCAFSCHMYVSDILRFYHFCFMGCCLFQSLGFFRTWNFMSMFLTLFHTKLNCSM